MTYLHELRWLASLEKLNPGGSSLTTGLTLTLIT
jgi:hypothetical protein